MDKKTAKKIYLQYGLVFLLSPNLKVQFHDLRSEWARGLTSDKLRNKLLSEDYARASLVFQLFGLDPSTSNVGELDKKMKEYTFNPVTGRSEPPQEDAAAVGLIVAPTSVPIPRELESLPTGGPSLFDLVKSFGGDPTDMTREDMIKFLEAKS